MLEAKMALRRFHLADDHLALSDSVLPDNMAANLRPGGNYNPVMTFYRTSIATRRHLHVAMADLMQRHLVSSYNVFIVILVPGGR